MLRGGRRLGGTAWAAENRSGARPPGYRDYTNVVAEDYGLW